MKIAYIIGHDRERPGKYSKLLGTSEYAYNCKVAEYLKRSGDVYKRPLGGSYKTQMRKLAEILNPKDYDLVIELHFNAFDDLNNRKGVGCETVHYPGSSSLKYGRKLLKAISEKYQVENRGAKEHGPADRGWWFLHYMDAPAIILEPFFGDEDECLKFQNEAEYAQLIIDTLCE